MELGNLALSRRKGESLRIGDATVTVVSVRGDRVKLAIRAPKYVSIVRAEIDDGSHVPPDSVDIGGEGGGHA